MLEHTKNKGDLGPEAQQDMNFCLTTCEEIAHVVQQQRLLDVGHLEQQLVVSACHSSAASPHRLDAWPVFLKSGSRLPSLAAQNTLDRGNMLFHDHLRALRTLLLGAPSPDEPPEVGDTPSKTASQRQPRPPASGTP
eukprot:COSAG01_NODE_6214_length_3788_cov_372.436704_5_plen_137_part_00